MNGATGKFSCDGCWEPAVAKARLTDGDVARWYEVYHRDAHKRQGLPEVRVPRSVLLP